MLINGVIIFDFFPETETVRSNWFIYYLQSQHVSTPYGLQREATATYE